MKKNNSNDGHVALDNLFYTCAHEKQQANEQFVPEHAFGIIIAGESEFKMPEGQLTVKQGAIGLVRRNQLLKTVKVPPVNGPFKSINIFLTQDFLRQYSAENNITASGRYSGPPYHFLNDDPFITGYFDSLMPYFDNQRQFSSALAELKTREAVELLLQHNAALKDLLFDFSEPHKIDLERYMNKHYMFNVPMDRFAQLTGRSLASFKRDFQKVFNTTPAKWLQQKRLEEARYLIAHKKQRPSQVYLEVGFEDLSHFSFVFKKTYGIPPSML